MIGRRPCLRHGVYLLVEIHLNTDLSVRCEPSFDIKVTDVGSAALPDVVVALVRADSGDRLLDYFKPGS